MLYNFTYAEFLRSLDLAVIPTLLQLLLANKSRFLELRMESTIKHYVL